MSVLAMFEESGLDVSFEYKRFVTQVYITHVQNLKKKSTVSLFIKSTKKTLENNTLFLHTSKYKKKIENKIAQNIFVKNIH